MRRITLFSAAVLCWASLSFAQELSVGKTGTPIKDFATIAGCSDGTNTRAQRCTSTGAASIAGSYTEDSGHSSGDTGIFVFSRRIDSPVGSAGASGDYAALNTNSNGALYVDNSIDGQMSVAKGLLKAEDTAVISGDAGVAILLQQRTTPASDVGTAGDYAMPGVDNLGAIWTDNIGKTVKVCAAITPDTSAYGVGDLVAGTGVTTPLSFANAFRTGINSGLIQRITITNTEVDSVPWILHLFTDNPTGSTVTDQGVLAVPAADLQKWSSFNCSSFKSLAAAEKCQADNLASPFAGASTTLYGALELTAAATWAAAQTVNVCVTILQD